MGEIDVNLLYNCTALLLDKQPVSNVSSVWSLNRTQVIEILSAALDSYDENLPITRSTELKDFLYECLFLPQQKPYDLPWWQKTAWSTVFAAMLLVATTGNVIVMWIVLGECHSVFVRYNDH